MHLTIKTTKTEWEGMAYIAIYGDKSKFEGAGIGQFAGGFKHSYIIVKDNQSHKKCGGIIKTMGSNNEDIVEIDPCLLNDLSVAIGSTIEILPLNNPVHAKQVRIAVSKNDLNQQELQNLFGTYLTRHPLSAGQKKPIYSPYTPEKITVEILEVQPHDMAIFSNSTELIIDTQETASFIGGLDEVGGLEQEKKTIRERILLPLLQPEFFFCSWHPPSKGNSALWSTWVWKDNDCEGS